MNSDLLNKNIVLFCPRFFEYDKKIKESLSKHGALVHLYNERIYTSTIGKALIRLNFKKIINRNIECYFDKIINSYENNTIDYIIIINPEAITKTEINKFKSNHKECKIIIYMWDSFINKKNAINLIDVADLFYTFEYADSIKYDVNFLPLFYTDDYKYNTTEIPINTFNACFIGTAHSKRYNITSEILKKTSCFFDNYIFYYSPSKLVFLYKKFITMELKDLPFSSINFTPMKSMEISNIIKKSKIIIDIPHNSQCGLTMRTIETIGLHKKLITTNSSIRNYNFYHSDNILIYDDHTTNDDIKNFLSIPYNNSVNDFIKNYHIDDWSASLFNVSNSTYFLK